MLSRWRQFGIPKRKTLEAALGRWRHFGIARKKTLELALGRWRQFGMPRIQMLESHKVVGVNLVSLEYRRWNRR